jgi:hypothetical protein
MATGYFLNYLRMLCAHARGFVEFVEDPMCARYASGAAYKHLVIQYE